MRCFPDVFVQFSYTFTLRRHYDIVTDLATTTVHPVNSKDKKTSNNLCI